VDGPLERTSTNLASPAQSRHYLRKPSRRCRGGELLGTHKTLGLARAKKARFLLASTSEVYGTARHPQPETYGANVNRSGRAGSYDESKRFAEAMTVSATPCIHARGDAVSCESSTRTDADRGRTTAAS